MCIFSSFSLLLAMSLSVVHGTLSTLKACQADIGTGMDILTDVAMDLTEAQGI